MLAYVLMYMFALGTLCYTFQFIAAIFTKIVAFIAVFYGSIFINFSNFFRQKYEKYK